jgi:hypothetical protein
MSHTEVNSGVGAVEFGLVNEQTTPRQMQAGLGATQQPEGKK